MALVYEPLEGRTTDALAAIQAYSFNVPEAVVAPWWDLAGREHVRVVREGDEVLGGAFLIWMASGSWAGACRSAAWPGWRSVRRRAVAAWRAS